MSKIFGDFENIDELNETARNLREGQEYDDLLVLGLENGLDEERVKKFYESKNPSLIDEQEAVPKTQAEAENGTKTSEIPDNTKQENVPKKEETTKVEQQAQIKTYATAEDKLKAEAGTAKNNTVPTQPISKHLIDKCAEDAEFAKLILIPHKTLEKCFKHVESEARKKLNNRTGWIDDNEVYRWSEDYYKLDDAEIERINAEKKKKDDELRKKQAEKAKTAQPAQPAKKSEPAKEAPKKAEPASTKDKGKKPKPEGHTQLSLFDFGGEDIE